MFEKINEILHFWINAPQAGFSESEAPPQKISPQIPSLWDLEQRGFDEALQQKFEQLYYSAIHGKCDAWLAQPKSCLAYIILIDQIAKRIHRDTPTPYQYDHLALHALETGRAHKLDKDLTVIERSFFYMPYLSAESVMHQQSFLALMQQLANLVSSPIEKNWIHSLNEMAQENYVIIQNFNRFPERNDILGRESTQAEILYLKLPDNFC